MNYPGPYFTIIGGLIPANQTNPATETLCVFGLAQDGPSNLPVQVSSPKQVAVLFGPASYSGYYLDPNTNTASNKDAGTTLPQRLLHAVANGCQNINFVRVGGTYATCASSFGGNLSIQGYYPGRIYNQVTVAVSQQASGTTTLTITAPLNKGGTVSYTLPSTGLIQDLIKQVNGDYIHQQAIQILDDAYPATLLNALSTLTTGSCQLSGGTNGCRAKGEDNDPSNNGSGGGMTKMAQALTATDTGTFAQILGMQFSAHVYNLTGIYFDDQVVDGGAATSTSIGYDFANFLDQASVTIQPCRGVIACRPPHKTSQANIISHINNNLMATAYGFADPTVRWIKAGPILFNGFYRTDPIAGTIDLGRRLSVVAGPEVAFSHPDIGTYTDMWDTCYAALQTTIHPSNAPIFKPLSGIMAFGQTFPKHYCDMLVSGVGFNDSSNIAGMGAYVCLTKNPRNFNGPLVVFDDGTAAARNDFFRQYQLMHLADSIMTDLNNILFPFIGGSTAPAAQAAMKAAAQNVMDGYVQNQSLSGPKGQGYTVNIHQDGNDGFLGAIRVDVAIQPARALRTIYFTLSVEQGS